MKMLNKETWTVACKHGVSTLLGINKPCDPLSVWLIQTFNIGFTAMVFVHVIGIHKKEFIDYHTCTLHSLSSQQK